MAGVTNVAFRTLCRELEETKAGTVSGLYVCEMVTARALVERHPVTMHMTTFAPDESPRSLQLYSVDPATTYAAAEMVAAQGDQTRRRGGAAVQAPTVRPDRRRRGARHRRHRDTGDRQVPRGHRRRPPHAPGCRPHRRSRRRCRGRAARP